jgi:hypothetical protein
MTVLSISFAKTHPGGTVPIFNTLVSTGFLSVFFVFICFPKEWKSPYRCLRTRNSKREMAGATSRLRGSDVMRAYLGCLPM